MSFLDSRFIGFVDVPDPKEISARFVYNFFVPDERTNDDGASRFQGVVTKETQRLISNRTMEAQLPRFVEIEFDEVRSGDGNINDLNNQKLLTEERLNIDTEETISSDKDAAFRYRDNSLRSRIKGRAEILAKLMNADMSDVKAQLTAITDLNENIDANDLQQVLSPERAPGISFVNEVGELFDVPVFSKASTLTVDMFLERRLLRPCFAGNFKNKTPLSADLLEQARSDALKFLQVTNDDSGEDSFEPEFKAISSEEVGDPSDEIKSLTVGYIIERQEIEPDGSAENLIRYYVDGQSTTRFVDTKVRYGSTYSYALRTVALVEMTIETDGETNLEPGFYNVRSLVASRPSKPTLIQAIERRPPLSPDGVFYQFNYDDGRGLIVRWQIPVGKQRDVKYFQIFRRKSIYEPFTCIAEIDFDDSTIKSPRAERVNPDRVHKASHPQTQFIDSDFTRDSSYIYAVAAIDAHGMSSGYSAQSSVIFDKINNTLDLKIISRSGAPKQYPNFFVDPDLDDNIFVDSLTQDSMQSSKKFGIRVYFDPDTVKFTSRDGRNEAAFVTDNNAGTYKFHLLNIDRQKATIMEMRIDDLR